MEETGAGLEFDLYHEVFPLTPRLGCFVWFVCRVRKLCSSQEPQGAQASTAEHHSEMSQSHSELGTTASQKSLGRSRGTVPVEMSIILKLQIKRVKVVDMVWEDLLQLRFCCQLSSAHSLGAETSG